MVSFKVKPQLCGDILCFFLRWIAYVLIEVGVWVASHWIFPHHKSTWHIYNQFFKNQLWQMSLLKFRNSQLCIRKVFLSITLGAFGQSGWWCWARTLRWTRAKHDTGSRLGRGLLGTPVMERHSAPHCQPEAEQEAPFPPASRIP